MKILQNLTGWRGHQVLYFGDHPYSDLADVTLEHGWRTGAIINELSVRFIAKFYQCSGPQSSADLNLTARNRNAQQRGLQMQRQLASNADGSDGRHSGPRDGRVRRGAEKMVKGAR